MSWLNFFYQPFAAENGSNSELIRRFCLQAVRNQSKEEDRVNAELQTRTRDGRFRLLNCYTVIQSSFLCSLVRYIICPI